MNAPASVEDFAGKTVLVTGGSQGIGRAIANRFADAGAIVTIADVRPPADETTLGFVEADAADPGAVRDAVATAAVGGRLDVCVANAGLYREYEPFEDTDPEVWRQTLLLNVAGVLVTSQAAALQMRAQDPRGGVILEMASVAGQRAEPECPAYSASKAGVVSIVESLAVVLGKWGIRVNGIAPGPIETPAQAEVRKSREGRVGSTSLAEATPEEIRSARRPIQRIGQPTDVAELAAFLASERASYITGTVVTVDGGGRVL